jgi:uncharacterized protein (TIGR02391 family)
MSSVIEFVPDADTLLALEAEDLGIILVQIIQRERAPNTALSNIEMPIWNANSKEYPHHKRMAVGRAFAEAWQWLQNEGLLMPDPQQPNGFYCLTRKGARLRSKADIEAYRQGNLLPNSLLAIDVVEKVRPMFMRGDYEVAVFQAFKEVEIAVRETAKLPAELVGVSLMRRAFHPENGPLADASTIPAEREAVMHLFAGAMGHAKNPHGHREVQLGPGEAAQLIVFASYLLGVVSMLEVIEEPAQSAQTK